MILNSCYSFEYDPKALDGEDKNLEHFNTFADEADIPSVSARSCSSSDPHYADFNESTEMLNINDCDTF